MLNIGICEALANDHILTTSCDVRDVLPGCVDLPTSGSIPGVCAGLREGHSHNYFPPEPRVHPQGRQKPGRRSVHRSATARRTLENVV